MSPGKRLRRRAGRGGCGGRRPRPSDRADARGLRSRCLTAADEASSSCPSVSSHPSCRSTALRRCWMILLNCIVVVPSSPERRQPPATLTLPAHGDLMHEFLGGAGASSGRHALSLPPPASGLRRRQSGTRSGWPRPSDEPPDAGRSARSSANVLRMRSASPGSRRTGPGVPPAARQLEERGLDLRQSGVDEPAAVNSSSGKARTCDGSRSFSTRLYTSACSWPLVNTSMIATRPPGGRPAPSQPAPPSGQGSGGGCRQVTTTRKGGVREEEQHRVPNNPGQVLQTRCPLFRLGLFDHGRVQIDAGDVAGSLGEAGELTRPGPQATSRTVSSGPTLAISMKTDRLLVGVLASP